ncbi:MAG: thioredoxin family protein [Bacilli bacterium]
MKKLVIGIIAFVIIALGALYFLQNNDSDTNTSDLKLAQEIYGKEQIDPETVKEINEPFYQNQMTREELSNVVEKKEDALIYFYSPTCFYCKEFAPTLQDAVKTTDSKLALHNLLEFPENWDDFKIEGTPTLIAFKDGKEVDRLVGQQPLDATLAWLEKNK